jgi:hypothetical protein
MKAISTIGQEDNKLVLHERLNVFKKFRYKRGNHLRKEAPLDGCGRQHGGKVEAEHD